MTKFCLKILGYAIAVGISWAAFSDYIKDPAAVRVCTVAFAVALAALWVCLASRKSSRRKVDPMFRDLEDFADAIVEGKATLTPEVRAVLKDIHSRVEAFTTRLPDPLMDEFTDKLETPLEMILKPKEFRG